MAKKNSKRSRMNVVTGAIWEKGNHSHYVGRTTKTLKGSPLGNPYFMGDGVDRERTIEKYYKWLSKKVKKNNKAVMKEVRVIEGLMHNLAITEPNQNLVLKCFCRESIHSKDEGQSCHADVIIKLLKHRRKNK